jgi:predicted aspartyl protease
MKVKLLFIIILAPFYIYAQNIDFDKGILKEKKYFEEVPYELVNGKIIVPVQINGKNYKFLLDTGAPNIISTKIRDELKISNVSATKIEDANDLVQEMQFTQIPSLNIGNLNFENQIALIYDFENHILLNCYEIDGIIGSNLFQNSVLKISTSEQKIFITDNVKNLNPKSKPTKIKLIGSQKGPYIEFNFVGKNNKKASDMALIDTGMDGLYEMSNRAFKIFNEYAIFETIAESEGISAIGIFGAAKPAIHRLLKVEHAFLNNTSIKNLRIETTNDSNSRIGLEWLNYGDVIIDWKKQKAYFESITPVILENKTPKYSPSIIDNKFVIGIVWDENLKNQMTSGDEIITVDSIKINELTPCEILHFRKDWKNKKNYILEIKNKENKIVPIQIKN